MGGHLGYIGQAEATPIIGMAYGTGVSAVTTRWDCVCCFPMEKMEIGGGKRAAGRINNLAQRFNGRRPRVRSVWETRWATHEAS